MSLRSMRTRLGRLEAAVEAGAGLARPRYVWAPSDSRIGPGTEDPEPPPEHPEAELVIVRWQEPGRD